MDGGIFNLQKNCMRNRSGWVRGKDKRREDRLEREIDRKGPLLELGKHGPG